MRIFAPNEVVAKSRFWYFMRTLNKLKKSKGEIIAVHELFDKSPTVVKNYGILLRYRSKSGQHNMWKEFRDTTRTGAVSQMYRDMGGRHRADYYSIQIIDVRELKAGDTCRANLRQFHDSKIRFPLPHRVNKTAEQRRFSTKFKAARPNTYFG